MVSGPLPPNSVPPVTSTTPPATTAPPSPPPAQPTQAPPPQTQSPPPPPPESESMALNRSNGTDSVQISQQAVNNLDRPPLVEPSSQFNMTTQSPNTPNPPVRPGDRPQAAGNQTGAPEAPGNMVVRPAQSPVQDLMPGQSIDLMG